MLSVFLDEVFVVIDYPSSFSGLPTVQFLIACSTIKNWTVGRPGNKASCSPRLLYSGGHEKFSLGMRLGLLAIESKACIMFKIVAIKNV